MEELKSVPVSELTLESANWIAHEISGNKNPHISSRYKEGDHGIILGVESFVTFRKDAPDAIMELMAEHKIGLQYIDVEWCAGDMDGKYFQRADSIPHAVLKSFAHMMRGKKVSVPTRLQDK